MCQLLITKAICQTVNMGKYVVHQGALLVVVCEKRVLKMTLSYIFMGGGGNHQMMT